MQVDKFTHSHFAGYHIHDITTARMKVILSALELYLEAIENSYEPQSIDAEGRETLRDTRSIILALVASPNGELAEFLTLRPEQLAEPGAA